MPTVKADRGLRFTLGQVCANQRWQIVVPILSDSALVPKTTGLNVANHFESDIIPKWKSCFAADCYIDGYTVEGMCPGIIIPIRHVFPPTQHVGNVTGESYSPNASMLGVFYSSDQATTPGQKTHVAKQFLGPPPEGKCAADSVDLAFCASELATYLQALLTWTTTGGGPVYTRALRTDNAPAV